MSVAQVQRRIFTEFYNDMIAHLDTFKKTSNKLLENNVQTVAIVDRLLDIKDHLDSLIGEVEELDKEILSGIVDRTEKEDQRYKEHMHTQDLIDTFMPAMLAYSLQKK